MGRRDTRALKPKAFRSRRHRVSFRPKKLAKTDGPAELNVPFANPKRIFGDVSTHSALYADYTPTSTYNWAMESPSSGSGGSCAPCSVTLTSKLKPLSRLCADLIASKCLSLHPSYLGSWSIWKLVWQSILANGWDSPAIFGMFARKFGLESTFRCHNSRSTLSNKTLTRERVLETSRIPQARYIHRLETVYANVSLKNVSSYIHGHQFKLLLDISFSSSLDILGVFQLANLTALDLSSHPQVTDSFLHQLTHSINENRFPDLKVILLVRCPKVSKVGVQHLLTSQSKVALIESDHLLIGESGFAQRFYKSLDKYCAHVEGTSYECLPSVESKVLLNFPLGMKLYALESKHGLDVGVNGKVLFDMFVDPTTSEQRGNSWSSIELRRNVDRKGFCYLMNAKSLHPASDSTVAETTTSKNIGVQKPISKTNARNVLPAPEKPYSKRRKPIQKSINVDNFFNLS